MNARSQRWAMIAGLVFIPLFVVGVFTYFDGQPDFDGSKDSPDVIASKVHAAVSSSSDRHEVLIGAYLLVLASFALIWFVQGLRSRLSATAEPGELAPALTSVFGTLAAAALSLGAVLGATIAGSVEFGDEPVPGLAQSDATRLITELGIPCIFVVFGLAMSAMVAVVSVSAVRRRGFPQWVGYVGVLGVLGGIFTVIFLPAVFLLLWVLIVSVVGLIGTRGGTATPGVGSPMPVGATQD